MTFDEYQQLARRTANLKNSAEERRVNWALGLCGEAGEVAEHVKKLTFHGHMMSDFSRTQLLFELGDVLWYVSQMASELGADLERVAQMNIEKLKTRYPDGFSEERSINRSE